MRRADDRRGSPRAPARCRPGRPAGRRRRCRAAPSSGRCPPCRPARRRRPAAATRGSSPGRAGGSGPRSCGCPTGPRRPRGRSPRSPRRPLVERPGVADARRAAVAGQGEAERLERRHQPGRLEIPGDDARAGRQRRLDRRPDAQPAGDGVAGEQAGADHHGRVGRVGAGRDRGDRDRAGPDGDGRPPISIATGR